MEFKNKFGVAMLALILWTPLAFYTAGRGTLRAVPENPDHSAIPQDSTLPKGPERPYTIVAQTSGPIVLGNGATRVPLLDAAPATSSEGGLAALLKRTRPKQQLFLLLRDLSAAAAPGTLYHIFLNLPEDHTLSLSTREPHLVGNLNFFNFVRTSNEDPGAIKQEVFCSYDITPVARKLGKRGLLTRETTVTIVPDNSPEAGSEPVIGRLEIVARADNSRN
jgi:hypothetical protein